MAFKSKADRAAYDKRRREAKKNGTHGADLAALANRA